MSASAASTMIWFPVWQGSRGHHASWVLPITAPNVRLQQGAFGDLDLESLRPARNDEGPVLTGTADGLLRGRVLANVGVLRHIDVRCKIQAGAFVNVDAVAAGRGLPDACAPTAPAGRYQVVSVRGLRLQAFYLEETGAPWIRWRELTGQTFTSGVYANAVWDSIMSATRPQPYRTQSKRNPWVWHLELMRL